MQRFTLAVAALLLLASAQAASAQRRLTGVVTEAGTGVPVVSATVTIVGATAATHTGYDGRFLLTIPSGPQTLRVCSAEIHTLAWWYFLLMGHELQTRSFCGPLFSRRCWSSS